MNDGTTELGGNTLADLKHRIERRVTLIEDMDKLRKQLGEFKADDKSEGFDEKAIVDAVKMVRTDPEKRFATLTFDRMKATYRKAAGIPTDLEVAAREARDFADTKPEPKSKKRKGRRGGFDA